MGVKIYSETFEALYFFFLEKARNRLSASQREMYNEKSFHNWELNVDGKKLKYIFFGEAAPLDSRYWANKLSAHRKPIKKHEKYSGEYIEENSSMISTALLASGITISGDALKNIRSIDEKAKELYKAFLKEHLSDFYDIISSSVKRRGENLDNKNIPRPEIVKDIPITRHSDNTGAYSANDEQLIDKCVELVKEYFDLVNQKKYDYAFNLLTRKSRIKFLHQASHLARHYKFIETIKPLFVAPLETRDHDNIGVGVLASIKRAKYSSDDLDSLRVLNNTQGNKIDFILSKIRNSIKMQIFDPDFPMLYDIDEKLGQYTISDFLDDCFYEKLQMSFDLSTDDLANIFPRKSTETLGVFYFIQVTNLASGLYVDDIITFEKSEKQFKQKRPSLRYSSEVMLMKLHEKFKKSIE